MTVSKALSALEQEATAANIAAMSPGQLRALDSQILDNLVSGALASDPQGQRDAQAARVQISQALNKAAGGDEYDAAALGGQRQANDEDFAALEQSIAEVRPLDPEQADRMQAALDATKQQQTANATGLAAYEASAAKQQRHQNQIAGVATTEQLEQLRDAAEQLRQEGNPALAAAVQTRYDRESVALRQHEQMRQSAENQNSSGEGDSDGE